MLTIGASHHTTSSAVLGGYSQAAEAFRQGLRAGADVPVRELAVLSTCARVELYAVADDTDADDAAQILAQEVFGAGGDAVRSATYRYRGHDAVRHVCRVASGIESFVVGEHEIAGQVQRAFKDVVRARGSTNVLGDVAAAARRASRRVRSETSIGRYPASVSSVAVDVVRDRLGDLGGVRALVVGAGRAGLLVARALRRGGIGEIGIVNRSVARARAVAIEVGGQAADLVGLVGLIAEADVVVTATGADGVIVDVAGAEQALRIRSRPTAPILMLDLALPGDVEPAVGSLAGLDLLTLEDVKARVHRHLSLRRDEVDAAERVVEEVVEDFVRSQETPDVEAAIGELRRSIEEVRSGEVARWMAQRESELPPTREELDHLTRSIVNKLLHDPMKRLRDAPRTSGASRLMLRAAREFAGATRRDPGSPAG